MGLGTFSLRTRLKQCERCAPLRSGSLRTTPRDLGLGEQSLLLRLRAAWKETPVQVVRAQVPATAGWPFPAHADSIRPNHGTLQTAPHPSQGAWAPVSPRPPRTEHAWASARPLS